MSSRGAQRGRRARGGDDAVRDAAAARARQCYIHRFPHRCGAEIAFKITDLFGRRTHHANVVRFVFLARLVSVAKRRLAFKIASFSRVFLMRFLDMSVCLWTHV